MNKLILNFKSNKSKKIKNPKNFLGGKGANLSQMGRMGLPVPPGFTISTKVCDLFYKNKKKLSPKILNDIKKELKHLEKESGNKFGDLKKPLLVSVRSGARVSMPGMMDTILNLGLNDKTVIALASKTSNMRFAKDSYRRFIQMYSSVVMGVDNYNFEELIENYKLSKEVLLDTELDENDWDALIQDFKNVVKNKTKKDFPQNVFDQLYGAISAVFLSWESHRAKVYRKLNQIPSEWGTAVNVQSMVFGNMGNDCATGVVFTRNPSDGKKEIYGEYLINAQGEDVVAGIRTPQNITKKARLKSGAKELSLEESMPKVFEELKKILKILESHYKDMQDVEFTVEKKKLWMLQTRSGKKTKICCTRKTIPGLRVLQKYSVGLGGGLNHRFNLSDEYLIKDNHIASSNLRKLITNAKKNRKRITVEVDNLNQLKKIMDLKFDAILFDNMSIKNLKKGLKLVGKKYQTEASGNINIFNVKKIATTGVKRISIGELTHSVRAIDLSLEI